MVQDSGKKMEMAKSNKSFISSISPYTDGVSASAKPGEIFSFWLLNALSIHNETGRASAFAPYDAYFATQASFRQSFSTFVDREMRGEIIGTSNAIQLLIHLIGSVLQFATEDITAHKHLETESSEEVVIIDDFLFDMFDILFDLNSEAACEWAARAIRSKRGFASTRSLGDTPSPILLYLRFVADDTTGTGRVNFYGALLEWCWKNSDEFEVQAHAFEILLLSLRAATEPGRDQKQRIVIEKLMTPFGENLQSILYTIDEEITQQNIILGEDDTLTWADRLYLEADSGLLFLISNLSQSQKENWRAYPLLMFAFANELTPSPSLEDSGLGWQFDPVGSAAEAYKIPIELILHARKDFNQFYGQH